ncbi:phosphatase PAP2 family protein [Streptomyces sp. NPDC006544]|uniref:phosphatase PAP2 family protein n=1 Tax=Streptomyces sp. NPDC006544 TaxID=3154583 RepID=UPI0033BEC0C4
MRSDQLRPWNRTGRALRTAALGAAVALAVLTALVVARWGPLMSFDGRVARDLHAHAVTHPGLTHVARVLSDWFWDPWTMRALAAVACLWLWRRGRGRCALRIALVILGAAAIQQGLKALVGRERPVWPDPIATAHYSAYPSGHALTATVVCGLLLWLVPRGAPRRFAWTAAALAAVTVLGVGFTRVYLGVHWLSDVLAGWLLGVVLVALAVLTAPGGAGGTNGACSGRSPASPRADFPTR